MKLESMEQDELDKEVVKNLKQYRGQSVLKRAAMNVLVKQLAPKQIDSLKKEFEKMDKDFSGFVEVGELEQALMAANFSLSAKEVKEIIM